MTIKKWIFLLPIFLLTHVGGHAATTVGDWLCNNCCGGCGLNFEIAALYWQPYRDDGVYGITDVIAGDLNTITFHLTEPEFDWGVRATIGYESKCCFFADLEYTYFDSTASDSTNNIFITQFFDFDIATPQPEATLRIEDEYQRLRGRVGYSFCNGCYGKLYTFGGVNWIYLQEAQKFSANIIPISTASPTQELTQRTRLHSAGFDVGLGGCLTVFNCLGLRGEFDGIGIIGNRTYDYFIDRNINLLDDYPDVTICIPGLDVRLEAFYSFNCFCPATIALGYEHHHFFNAIRTSKIFQGDIAVNPDQRQNDFDLGFGGMYIALRVNY